MRTSLTFPSHLALPQPPLSRCYGQLNITQVTIDSHRYSAFLTAANADFSVASRAWRLVITLLPMNRNLRCRKALRRHQSMCVALLCPPNWMCCASFGTSAVLQINMDVARGQ